MLKDTDGDGFTNIHMANTDEIVVALSESPKLRTGSDTSYSVIAGIMALLIGLGMIAWNWTNRRERLSDTE